MAQVAEHILGKDEVTSSNLVSSSIKALKLDCFKAFYFCPKLNSTIFRPESAAIFRQLYVPRRRISAIFEHLALFSKSMDLTSALC